MLEVNRIYMVKQRYQAKISSGSIRLGPAYLYFRDWLPTQVRVADLQIRGSLPVERTRHIPGQPHIALANLPSFESNGDMKTGTEMSLRLDEKAVEKFVKDYGALYEKDLPDIVPEYVYPAPELSFQEQISDFASAQLKLRKVWSGDVLEYFEMLKDMKYEASVSFPDKGFHSMFDKAYPGARLINEEEQDEATKHGVRVYTGDLWTFIRFLFLADLSEGKSAVCKNPNCLVPYFVKKRKNQTLCEQGECVKWAQRQYSLRWWNAEGGGKERRKKKLAERQNKRKRNKR
jgi:hypothetical protein